MNISTKSNLYDYHSKILLIGDSSVGKTSIIMRFVNNKFSPSFITTIGIDQESKIIDISGVKVKLQLWDTAGQERFRAITASYFRGAHMAIIIYDVCEESTFNNVKVWIESINNFVSANKIAIILVGNKIDVESSRQVSYKRGVDLAKKYNVPFFECSAKRGINVNLIFEEAGKIHLEKFSKTFNEKLIINNKKSYNNKCCN